MNRDVIVIGKRGAHGLFRRLERAALYLAVGALEDLLQLLVRCIRAACANAAARGALIDILANYQGFRKCRVIVVFDAYKVKGNPGSVQTVHGVKVVYTKEAETADTYIERATYELRRERRVRVATSDGPEQVIILGHGALRVSARAFHAEVEAAEGQISAVLQSLVNRPHSERTVRNNVKIKQ